MEKEGRGEEWCGGPVGEKRRIEIKERENVQIKG